MFPQVDGVTILSIDDQTLAQFVPNLVIVVRYGPSANPDSCTKTKRTELFETLKKKLKAMENKEEPNLKTHSDKGKIWAFEDSSGRIWLDS